MDWGTTRDDQTGYALASDARARYIAVPCRRTARRAGPRDLNWRDNFLLVARDKRTVVISFDGDTAPLSRLFSPLPLPYGHAVRAPNARRLVTSIRRGRGIKSCREWRAANDSTPVANNHL